MTTKVTTPKCERDYVAYIHIMGYGQFCDDEPDEAAGLGKYFRNKIEFYKEYIPEIAGVDTEWVKSTLDIRFVSLGESLAFAMSVGYSEREIYRVLAFLSIISDLQSDLLLEEKVLIRGAVSVEAVEMEDNSIQGPGLVRAMKLVKSASGPQIVVDKSLMMFIYNSNLLGDAGLSWIWRKLVAMRGVAV